MKIVDEEQVKKLRSEFTLDDLVALRKNSKSKNVLIRGLGLDKYNMVPNYTIAKHIWDELVNSHKGTRKVRKFRITLLFAKYKAFKMMENESSQEIITRLTSLVNWLSSLGKISHY